MIVQIELLTSFLRPGYPNDQELSGKVEKALHILENELTDRCRSLNKMIFNEKTDFMLEIKDDKYYEFYVQWYSMNVEPKEWVNHLSTAKLAGYIQGIINQGI